ncbi:MAG TPA: peptidase U32 family protein [Myxococcota bacterium]|nr:peptidase U32 family protein [Myxococcota bacterium]HQK51228.1 peptidase U32 family protein [Myxococcota bacterium]
MERPPLEDLLERVRQESEGLEPLPPFRLLSFETTDRCHLVLALPNGETALWIARAWAPGGAFWRGRLLAVGHPREAGSPDRVAFLRLFCARLARIENLLPEDFLAALGRPGDGAPEARDPVGMNRADETEPGPFPETPPPSAPESLPRLLAPLSSPAHAEALARAGADAFYAGLLMGDLRNRLPGWSDESTRNPPKANLSPDRLATTVDLCHRLGRPLFLALNRPYPPSALPTVLREIDRIVEAGADGLVLADWALALEVRRRWPDLTRIASTVLGIHHPDGLRLAQEAGFHRVVLPRPLTIREIRALARQSPVDLEVFVARERCRFQNATCHLEHCPPRRPGDGRLEFEQDVWCIRSLESDDGPWQVDLGSETLESCGLCAVAALRDLPRIRSFKIVGRGLPLPLVLPFVQLARKVLDQDLRDPKEVRREVRMDGRITCSRSSCYFPDPLPASPGRRAPNSRPPAGSWTPVPETPAGPIPRWALLPFGTVALPPGEGLEGVLLGHETCVHLLPTPATARRLGHQAIAAGLGLGLVLPPLFGSQEARRGLALAEALLALHPGTEVTANDVGTLAALRTHLGETFPVALGRLLVPQRNDPRLARFPKDHPARGVLSEPPLPHLEALVQRFGACRVEVSIPLRWPDPPLPWPLGVHLGPSLLSVARSCPTFNEPLEGPGSGRPFGIPAACPRPCLGRSRRLRDRDGGESFRVQENNVLVDLPLPEGSLPTSMTRWILHHVPASFPEASTTPRPRPQPTESGPGSEGKSSLRAGTGYPARR